MAPAAPSPLAPAGLPADLAAAWPVAARALAEPASADPDALRAHLRAVARLAAGPLPSDVRLHARAVRAALHAALAEPEDAALFAAFAAHTLEASPAARATAAPLLAAVAAPAETASATADPASGPADPASATAATASPADDLLVTLAADRVRIADGPWIDLARRGPTRRILRALAEARLAGAGGLDTYALFAAGWPGEDPHPEAQANRVYVVLNTLRGLGLRTALRTFDDGYRLVARVVLTG